MSNLIFLIGLPASGKSTLAKKISEKEKAKIVSSDNLRKEIYGDINNQENNKKLFRLLYKKIDKHLKNNENVIIDSTNLFYKKRMELLNDRFKGLYDKAKAYYITADISTIYNRNKLRNKANNNRYTPKKVIDEMIENLYIPTFEEGFDKIFFEINQKNQKSFIKSDKILFKELIFNVTNPKIFKILGDNFFNEISLMYNFNVKKHKKLSSIILQRTNYIKNLKKINVKEKEILLIANLYFDLGRVYIRNNDINNFQNISAHIASLHLKVLGFEKEFIIEVVKTINYLFLYKNNFREIKHIENNFKILNLFKNSLKIDYVKLNNDLLKEVL